jgi:ATP-dependent DNA helicase RecQ
MTPKLRPILVRDEATIDLRRDTTKSAKSGPVKQMVSEEDAPLLSALQGQTPRLRGITGGSRLYRFNDKTLIEMAENAPKSL